MKDLLNWLYGLLMGLSLMTLLISWDLYRSGMGAGFIGLTFIAIAVVQVKRRKAGKQ